MLKMRVRRGVGSFLAFVLALPGSLLLAAPPAAPAAPAAEGATPPKAAQQASSSGKDPARKGRKDRERKAFDKPAEAERFYILKRSPDGVSPIPTEWVAEAVEKASRMPRYSTRSNRLVTPKSGGAFASEALATLGTWTPLGPGNVGGRIRGLVIDPKSPSTIYAGGVAGGVWKSDDAGSEWKAISSFLSNLAVTTLAMDPKKSAVLYAGTGEGFTNVDAVRGAGIFWTDDGGLTWKQLDGTATADFYYVNKIVVSPNDSSRLYAATRTGIWRRKSSGTAWENVLPVTAETGVFALGFLDLVIRSDKATDWVLAAEGKKTETTVDKYGTEVVKLVEAGRIWKNVDAGADGGTWTEVQKGGLKSRTSLAIAPSNQAFVYALTSSAALVGPWGEGLYAVYRSTDGGESWTAAYSNDWVTATQTTPAPVNNLLLSNPSESSNVACGFGRPDELANQGWYDNVIAVDPKNPDVVWAGGIDLFRSDDGGKSWGLASFWWLPRDEKTGKFPKQYVHADHHALVFHPGYNGTTNRVLFVGGDGGIYRTDDARARTSGDVCGKALGDLAWLSLNNGLGVTQFYNGAVYPNGQTYFGGTQDNGTVRGTMGDGPDAWVEILGGDGGYVAVDPENTRTLYAENTMLSLQKSTNGAKFEDAVSGITEPGSGFLFISPFAMDPQVSTTLWMGGGNIPWRTVDGAAAWTQAGASFKESITAIAVAPTNSDLVLMGTKKGKIFRTDKAGTSTEATTWLSVSPLGKDSKGKDVEGYVSSIAFGPEVGEGTQKKSAVYATYSTFAVPHVWKSTDGGANWVASDGSGTTKLPDIPVHSIAVDPDNGSRLYVGTDIGVFSSLDGGAKWAVENVGFANAPTEWLAVSSSTLYAFTHGRGAWRVALCEVPPTATVSGGGTVCAGKGVRISAALTGTAPWTLTWSDGVTQTGVPESPAERWVAPEATTVYEVRGVSDGSCAGRGSGSATVTVPKKPVIEAPHSVSPRATFRASIPPHEGSTYLWTVTGATIVGNATGATVTVKVARMSPVTLKVTETNAASCASPEATATVIVGLDPNPELPPTPLPRAAFATRERGAGQT